MSNYTEYTTVEKPAIDYLQSLGYRYIDISDHDSLRDTPRDVILRPIFIQKVKEINGLSDEEADKVYQDFLNVTDNEKYLSYLTGNYAKKFLTSPHSKTIYPIDFNNLSNNDFAVVNQLTVVGIKERRPDIIIYVNGIPLVVIECKGVTADQDIFDGARQLNRYEKDIPRLFYSNVFNISTNSVELVYGATGAKPKYYFRWKDPYPRKVDEFQDSMLDMGLYSLLAPQRLLDILKYFIIFERRENNVTKKICRYQQYRAVTKLTERVKQGTQKRGLIWHTQGSGKSLTMVFAARKLKFDPDFENPSILILTDRNDLDGQIYKTFEACGFPNPNQMDSIEGLRSFLYHGQAKGSMLMSTMQKFQDIKEEVQNSNEFIVFIDEAHRTQEGDLAAFLRKALPNAAYFGFTGTPVKNNQHDTYANFGYETEGYLDKYGIEDAVKDEATVPIFYTARMAKYHLDSAQLDQDVEALLKDLPDDAKDQIKRKQSTLKAILKNPERIEAIALDIVKHYKEFVEPDGFKAQVVACDREATILYKKHLDALLGEGVAQCIYSPSQKDEGELVAYYADKTKEKGIISNFLKKDGSVKFLIVCDKLLTGFDAPIEQVMYLDKPMKEHSLLQAIARTNRTYEHKKNGLIVDYVGISKKLNEALASYNKEDVKNALRDLDELKQQLKIAYNRVMQYFKGINRHTGDINAEKNSALKALGTLDNWYRFKNRLRHFFAYYEALSPDPEILQYREDVKWLAVIKAYGTYKFEGKEAVDIKEYGEKIREIVNKYLHVTGMVELISTYNIFDKNYKDPDEKEDPEHAALKNTQSIKKTISSRLKDFPIEYKKFSEYLEKILQEYEAGLIELAELINKQKELINEMREHEKKIENNDLGKAYPLYTILNEYVNKDLVNEEQLSYEAEKLENSLLGDVNIHSGWEDKDYAQQEVRKRLKQEYYKVVKKGKINEFAEKIVEYAKDHY